MAGRDDSSSPGRVFFEFIPLGQQMRVAAIDEATSAEVVVIAPLTATRHQMQQLALAKLKRKLAGGTDPPGPGAPPRSRYA
ncbi:MAG: serine hydroxymethyltransferase [Devosia sp.]|nr:serine hydroxymethyltransferase [Devosia sp.]